MTGHVAVGNARLHVVDQGTGHPLLLVHGFPLDHTMWRGQMDDLSRDYRVVAPDLRGFGRSDVSCGTVTMECFADDLAALLDALRIDEPVTYCGLSMGGYIAWQFWRRHGQRLSRLILCDTRAVADPPEAVQARQDLAQRIRAEGVEPLVEAMIPKLFGQRTREQHPAVIDATKAVIRATSPEGAAAALLGMARRVDATAWLPDLHVPTLVVCGEDDVISTVAEMRQIATALPQAQWSLVPACGHMAPLEDAPQVNQLIRAFLAGCAAA
ncbi:MAG: alpha/beta hydrolase [Pirellulaceae bacterium]|jgi:pimeloyl-ACP methyl ester carboxylesterase|nr:alpha/beta hydrolase [Pirellulaceae bacterium]